MAKMTAETALELFGQGFDCSQVVFGHAAEKLGMDKKLALRTAAAFGGGMWEGETCGCVTGALMALGVRYGHDEPGDQETKNALLEKKAAFEKAFCEKHGSCLCHEILGRRIPEDMEAIQAEGKLASLCPRLAASACEILEGML